MTEIQVRDISQVYGDNKVLENVNLDVKDKEFCSIFGSSGCGKSTFLRILLSQEKPSTGEVLIDGMPISSEPGPDRGVVFQRYSVFSHLSVVENLILAAEFDRSRIFGRLFGRARVQAMDEVQGMIEAVGLSYARDSYPMELSGGMQQRLAIAQALLRRPKVLLLDEPFGALDPGTRATMHDILLSLWHDTQMTVFMVTHDLEEGFKLGTRLVVFDKIHWDPNHPNLHGATIVHDAILDQSSELEEIKTKIRARLSNTKTRISGGKNSDVHEKSN